MTTSYASYYSRSETPQSEPIPGNIQVRNNAGGFAFALDDWGRLDRFLILGCESGSYYVAARTLTVENAEAVRRCIAADGRRVVDRIVAVSESGRAPKNDPAVFALALAASVGAPEVRTAALAAVPRVCRIGTHLFQFVEAVTVFRGWGRSIRRGVGAWYASKTPRDLAYQLVKYQQRGGWSHRDLLRLCHVKVEGPANAALRWAVGKADGMLTEPPDAPLALIAAFEAAKQATTTADIVRLIREYDLMREGVPTRWLAETEVWEALLEKMPLGALVRNLATMTRVGLLTPRSRAVETVRTALADRNRLKRSQLHPIALLTALKTYAAGQGHRATPPGARFPK